MSQDHIEKLSQYFAKIPGLGPRSARRAVLYLLTSGKDFMKPIANEINNLAESIRECESCRNLDTISPCSVCMDEKRDKSVLCVIEEVADLWAFERSNLFKGQYFVLGGTLSAIDGRGPEQLGMGILLQRVKELNIQEVIIATNATVEGQTTAHYIAEKIASTSPQTKTSRLAQGMPVGGELDYMDDGTINAALNSRQSVL
jgi:recombination protein RecR